MAGVRVELVSQTQGNAAMTMSKADGSFLFESVKPGTYWVLASKPPYAPNVVPEPTTSEPDRALRVEGRAIAGLEIALVPGGVITGRVVDPFGQPATGASIGIRLAGSTRERRLYSSTAASTFEADERGQYRLFGLPAGDYLVFAYGGTWNQPRLSSTDGKQVSFAPIFFPDAVDPAQADLVRIAPGQERTGIDLRLRLTVLYEISASLVNAPEMRGRYPQVQLKPYFSDLVDVLSQYFSYEQTSSGYRFRFVPPGHYWLTARADPVMNWNPEGGLEGTPPPARDTAPSRWAATEVFVTDSDVSGVTLVYQTASSVTGRVVLAPDGGGEAAAPTGRIQVSLVPAANMPRLYDDRLGATANAAGAFTLPMVAAGRYQLRVRAMNRELAISSISIAGVTTTGTILDVPFGELKDVVVIVKGP